MEIQKVYYIIAGANPHPGVMVSEEVYLHAQTLLDKLNEVYSQSLNDGDNSEFGGIEMCIRIVDEMTESLIKPCPNCEDGHMMLRQNKRHGGWFLGCSNWDYGKGCRHTEPANIEVSKLLAIREYALELCQGIEDVKWRKENPNLMHTQLKIYSFNHLCEFKDEVLEFIKNI